MKKIFYLMIATAFILDSIAAFAASPVKVACIGDSITYGAGIENRAKNSYPAQLAAALGSGWAVDNFGVSGATLLKNGDNPYSNTEQYRAALEYRPNIVVIKLGTNDSKPWNWKYKAEYFHDYVELINRFRSLESRPTILLAYPVPAYSDGWGISGKIIKEEIVPLIDEVSVKMNVRVIDLYAVLTGKDELFSDKIHPNAEGAKLIAETISAAIAKEIHAE